MEWRAVAIGAPETFAFPSGVRIVDPPIHALGEEAHRIGHAELDELAVDQNVQRVRIVAGGHRNVFAETERVVLIDERVIARFRAAGVRYGFELRAGQRIKRPTFRAVLAGRGRSVERALALAAVEAAHVAARKRRPDDALAVDVDAAG